MNSDTSDTLMPRNNKTLTLKKILNSQKENVEQENNMPGLNAQLKVTSPYTSFKGRKNSDSSYDRPLKSRALQGSNYFNNQGFIPKRRNHSSSEVTGTKSFQKPRFFVYDDDVFEEDNQGTAKIIQTTKFKSTERSNKSSHLRENAKSKVQSSSDDVQGESSQDTGKLIQNSKVKASEKPSKSSYLRESTKNNFPTVPNNQIVNETAATKVPNAKKSPENPPPIRRSDLLKIKEKHKKATSMRRTPRAVYDVLSLELAYNIDYMQEYVRFQMEINDKKKLSSNFLTREVTADQRRLIVKYLIKTTTYFKYPSFIVYQAVKIFDAYIDAVEVSIQELQVAALAALWIALKKDMIADDIPEASSIIGLAGNTLRGDKKLLIDCEKKILMSLGFEVSFAEPFSMLALYTVMIDEVRDLKATRIQDIYYYGSYLIDLSILNDETVDIPAMHLAAISAEVALVLTMTSEEGLKNPLWSYWRNRVAKANPIIEKYRWSDNEMNRMRTILLKKVILSQDINSDFHIVYRKYNRKRYGDVSNCITKQISLILGSEFRIQTRPSK